MEILFAIMGFAILGANAAPQIIENSTPLITIVSEYISPNQLDGSFNYSYEASNGIRQNNVGFVKRVLLPVYDDRGRATGQEQESDIIVQTGSYQYVAPDGQLINVTYVADENGFQPVGDHLPTPPPIPQDILVSLEQRTNNPGAGLVPIIGVSQNVSTTTLIPPVGGVPRFAASRKRETDPQLINSLAIEENPHVDVPVVGLVEVADEPTP